MKKAFSLVESILVIIIIGIISLIVITVFDPSCFKEEAELALAKKILAEIDIATSKVIINDTKNGDFEYIVDPETKTNYNITATENKQNYSNTLKKTYIQYLSTSRKSCSNTSECPAICATSEVANSSSLNLKNGACIRFVLGDTNSTWTGIFPEQEETTNFTLGSRNYFVISFDVNGKGKPNRLGIDQYTIPVGLDGINY